LVRRELLLGPVPKDRPPPRGREGARVERHVPDVAVAGQGPEPLAAAVPIPEERGLAAEQLEGLVWRACRELGGIREVDLRQPHARLLNGRAPRREAGRPRPSKSGAGERPRRGSADPPRRSPRAALRRRNNRRSDGRGRWRAAAGPPA